MAAAVPEGKLQAAFDSALNKRLTSVEELDVRLESLHLRGRPGSRVLKELLREAAEHPRPDSPLERRFIRLATEACITNLVRQFEIDIGWDAPIHIDFAIPEAKVGIETDGYGTHAPRSQWQLDRRRDSSLAALGWVILRFTWADIDRRPNYVVSTIRRVLAQRDLHSGTGSLRIS
jgi:very-short-patch-repair endonuclease